MPEIIKRFCDFDYQTGSEVEATEVVEVTVDRGKPRRLLLCAEHRASWWDPVLAVIEAAPEVVEPAASARPAVRPAGRSAGRPAREPLPCPVVENCAEGPFMNKGEAGKHVRSAHPDWWDSSAGLSWRKRRPGRGSSSDELLCPLEDGTTWKTRAALGKHLIDSHNISLAQLESEGTEVFSVLQRQTALAAMQARREQAEQAVRAQLG